MPYSLVEVNPEFWGTGNSGSLEERGKRILTYFIPNVRACYNVESVLLTELTLLDDLLII
jgi:hypothetical protein